ncbi:hypoxanthine phosphoribosyltransferase [bacterium BMS3Bbin04]|nr:hypoxanthine phosphoribosyltransferase [bacterium BMS3Bbin04]
MLTLRSEPLFTEIRIRERVDQLAERILQDIGGDKPLVAVGILRGCYVFMADLLRELAKRGAAINEQDFLIASSYGDETESTKKIKIERDLLMDIKDQRVLLIDDIIDTGHTLKLIRELLLKRNPEMIKTVTLLDKPERREVDLNADYSGFTIPNVFVVGYGLDYAQKYRELPYITVLEDQAEG